MINNEMNLQAGAIAQLSRSLFVFHAWQNLSILGTDGAMFNLDTRILDVDRENVNKETGISGGVPFIKRLRMVPITATQRAKINNREGFSVTNMFVGSMGADGQPKGMGSNMSGATRTNVEPEWSYPEQKIDDMLYTFGKYGLVFLRSCVASDAASFQRCQKAFDVVMSGVHDRTTHLEDLPEYFGEISMYLPEKKPARFSGGIAAERVEQAFNRGIDMGEGRMVKLDEAEYAIAQGLLAEIPPSIMQAHTMALDPEANGILAQTREGLQTGQKRGLDKADQWLLGQFPSYQMDTMLEKSNKQLLKALDAPSQETVQAPEGFVSLDTVQEMLKQQSDDFDERLKTAMAANGGQTAAATAAPAPAATPAAPPVVAPPPANTPSETVT